LRVDLSGGASAAGQSRGCYGGGGCGKEAASRGAVVDHTLSG